MQYSLILLTLILDWDECKISKLQPLGKTEENRKGDNIQCKLATFCLFSFVSVKNSFKKNSKMSLLYSSKHGLMDTDMGIDIGT